MTPSTSDPDPVDIAASFPQPPAHDDGPAEVVLSAEHLTAGTEWTVSGAVRFRRRVATYTRSVEVTVRREELQVEVRDLDDRGGAWFGTDLQGPAVPAPPIVTGPGVFVLREEVPEVTLTLRPYEQVTVLIDRRTEHVQVRDTVRREAALVSGDTGAPHPAVPPQG